MKTRGARAALVFLAGAAALALAARADDENRPLALADVLDAYEPEETPWVPEAETVETILAAAPGRRGDPVAARQALSTSLGLAPALGQSLIDAIVASANLETEILGDLPDGGEAALTTASRAFEEAASASPDPLPIARSWVSFLDRWEGTPGADVRPLARWLSTSARAVPFAIELSRCACVDFDAEEGDSALTIALGSRPDDPSLLLALARSHGDPAVRIAAAERAAALLSERGAAVPARARAEAVARRLEALLEAGLASRALGAASDLPPEIREALIEGESLPLDLAAAAVVERDDDSARAWLAVTRATSNGRSILDEILAPSGRDPFRILVDRVDQVDGLGHAPGARSATWLLAAARLAERAGYDGFAAYFLAEASRPAEGEGEGIGGSVSRLPRYLASEAGRNEAAIALAREAALARREALDGGVASGREESITRTIARSLREPRLAAFDSRSVPATVPDEAGDGEGDEVDDGDGGGMIPPAWLGLGLPPRLIPVRVESHSDLRVALCLGMDYGRFGESRPSVHWVVRSSDGGATWERPLYTGIGSWPPFAVARSSAVPLLVGDGLDVEGEFLEPTPADGPGVPAASAERPSRVVLHVPWERLVRDRDEDGLTDLVEERLLTDPRSRDTDGDGLDDARDPLPHVPFDPVTDDASTILRLVLPLMTAARDVRDAPPGFPAGAPRTDSAPLPPRTTFVVAPRASFRAVAPSRRLVVLTAGERDAYERKLGSTWATELRLLEIDRAALEGIVLWGGEAGRGRVRVEKTDGAWRAASRRGP